MYVEDRAVKRLARTRLAKSVHDARCSQFVVTLEYRAAKRSRYLGQIGRFEPTSQVCSACGSKDGPTPLSDREWTCQDCKTVRDRDINAACNILTAGRTDRPSASWRAGNTGSVQAQHIEAGSH